MRTCSRCGVRFPLQTPQDRRCGQCEREVASILTADLRRRERAVFVAKDFTRRVLA